VDMTACCLQEPHTFACWNQVHRASLHTRPRHSPTLMVASTPKQLLLCCVARSPACFLTPLPAPSSPPLQPPPTWLSMPFTSSQQGCTPAPWSYNRQGGSINGQVLWQAGSKGEGRACDSSSRHAGRAVMEVNAWKCAGGGRWGCD
jgi:hypothetical protein